MCFLFGQDRWEEEVTRVDGVAGVCFGSQMGSNNTNRSQNCSRIDKSFDIFFLVVDGRRDDWGGRENRRGVDRAEEEEEYY